MAHRVFDVRDVEERRKPVRSTLGVTASGINHFETQPGQARKPHDEAGTGQEEVYVALRGHGAVRIGDEEVDLEPGRDVLVSPEETRQVVAGEEGLSYAVVGGRPGPFEPPGAGW